MVEDCETAKDFEGLLGTSYERPVFLFKHSTRCGISAGRWRAFCGLAETEPRAVYRRVLVIENRDLSREVAQKTGITHQSPQVILFHNGRAVWDASHYSITEAEMTKALEQALG
jgi:bacillithiol system protein YtxJ